MLSSVKSCGICGRRIYDDLDQREAGDFHGRCYEALGTSGLRLTTAAGDAVACLMCARPIAKGVVAVELLETGIAHLRCFFGTTNGDARSLGAAAATRSLMDQSHSLRAQSNTLIDHSHMLLARLRARHLLN